MSDSLGPYVDLHSTIQNAIEDKCWAVVSVEGDNDTDIGFCYTIGLTDLGLPELIIAGIMDVSHMESYLNAIGLDMADGTISPNSQTLKSYCLTKTGTMDMSLVELDTRRKILHEEYTVQLFEHYNRNANAVRLMQVYWPDTNGNFQDSAEWNCGKTITFLPKASGVLR